MGFRRTTGIKAKLEMLPMQPGDVNQTWANVDDLITKFNFHPTFPVDKGVANFVQWYKEYYNI